MKTLFVLASIAGVLFLADANRVEAKSAKVTKVIEGTIAGFGCGDNCYLTITDKKGKEHTGLCSAPLCNEWNAQGMMPERYKGTRVKVTVSRGTRFDGAGRVVDTFEAFTKIRLLK
jgi:hypothetical protein